MNSPDPLAARLDRMRAVMEAASHSTVDILTSCLEGQRAHGIHAGRLALETTELWYEHLQAVLTVMREDEPDTVTYAESKVLAEELGKACLGLAAAALATLAENDSGAGKPRIPQKTH